MAYKTITEARADIAAKGRFKAMANIGPYMKGRIYKVHPNGLNVTTMSNNGAQYVYLLKEDGSVYTSLTLAQVSQATQSEEDLLQLIQDYEQEISEAKDRIAYIKASKSIEYDETEFKVWRTLQVIKSKKGDDFEKAKEIAKLINGQ